jgi:hypothetical protein
VVRFAAAVMVVCALAGAVLSAPTTGPVRRLVLEEQRIEGKIRRPQLVLIKADQRPAFNPIVVQGVGSEESITRSVSQAVIEKCPYREPFKLAGKRVVIGAP